MIQRWLLVAVALPVLGIAALITHAELRSRGGIEWRVPVTGYDPRDLLSGHYLLYRYAWEPAPGTCVCLREGPTGRIDPSATRVSCDNVAGCGAWIRGERVDGPQQFFISEERAPALERAFLRSRAHVGISVRDGDVVVHELYLDGRPWREVVEVELP